MSQHTRSARPFGPDAATLVDKYIQTHQLRVLGNWSTVRPVPLPVTR